MSEDNKKIDPSQLVADFTACAEFLVKLEDGATHGMRGEQTGLLNVRAEIVANQSVYGGRAGITADNFALFTALNERIDMLDARLPGLLALVKIAEGSRKLYADERESLINVMAGLVDTQAKVTGNEDLLGKYQLTRNYRSEPGYKAAKTRKKNAKAKASASNPQAAAATPPVNTEAQKPPAPG